ncbi:chitin-binding protein, partial [Streptomyces chartreusis]
TPDTYYSCSDVVFPAGNGAGAGTGKASATASAGGRTAAASSPAVKPRASERHTTDPSPTAAATTGAETPPTQGDSVPVASTGDAGRGPAMPLVAGGAAAVLVLTGGAALALRLRRR